MIEHPTLGRVHPGTIAAEFVCSPECPICEGEGHVCEDHPTVRWREGDGCCGAPGMPCPSIALVREAAQVRRDLWVPK